MSLMLSDINYPCGNKYLNTDLTGITFLKIFSHFFSFMKCIYVNSFGFATAEENSCAVLKHGLCRHPAVMMLTFWFWPKE